MKSEFARLLLEKNAVKISTNPPFEWTSGIKSPIYCDNRLLISFPDARKKIISGFLKLIAENNLKFDTIAGTATAAIPWAAFLAVELDCPMVYVRPKPKSHGAGKQVEGTMPRNSRVLIVEDLFSTGGSSIRSATACKREFDAEIVATIAIFSYEFASATENFNSAGIKNFTLSGFSALVDELEISDDEKRTILEFSSDPEGWEAKIG